MCTIKIRLIRLNKVNCRVVAQNESLAKLPCRDAQNHGLSDEIEVSPEEFARIKQDVLVPEAVKLATSWLARREMSRLQVAQGLRRRGFCREIAEAALDRLQDYGYVDDARFAEALLRLRQNDQPYGKLKLAADLRSKGITGRIADTTMQAFDEKKALGLAVNMARRRGLNGRRLYNFLYRRGFSTHLIQQVMDEDEYK